MATQNLVGSPGFDHLLADVRYAMRAMRRSPGFYAVAVAILAVGIGINAAIFSVFSHVLLAPLQFPDSASLYVVSSHAPSLGDARRAASGPDFRDFRAHNQVFSGVAAVIPTFSEVWTGDGEPRVLHCAAPSMDFFNVLGIRPALGRFFVPEEFHDLHNSTVLISWKFWREQLGGDPHIIGRSLRIEDVSSTVVGVLPPMPDLYSDVDVWLKLTTEPSWEYMNWRANKFLDVIGRLKPRVSRSVAEQQLTSILRRGEGEPRDVQVQLTPLKDFVVGPVRNQLRLVMLGVGLVLLVTCLNTAALLLTRAVRRSSELAVRMSLGASSGRIRQQLFVEGVLLSVAGAVLGIFFAWVSMNYLWRVPGLTFPRLSELHLNSAALLASIAIAGFTSMLFAVLPARIASRVDLASSLSGGRTETGRTQRRPFSVLVVAEICFAVVLTLCAGMLVRSFIRLQQVDLGFQPSRVLTAYLRTNYFGPEGYPFWRNVLDTIAHLPGATSAAVSDCMPASRANAATLVFADRPNDPNHAPASEACWISADYFRTLGSALLKGRFFSGRDNDTAPPVAIISADAAQQFFPGENPIGKRIAVHYLGLGTVDTALRVREIVGIVSNVRHRSLDLPSEPAVYVPYLQDETHHVLASMNLFVRSTGEDPGLLATDLRTRIQSMYPNQPVERMAVMPQVVSRTLVRRTYTVGLISAFAGLALLLCAVGIYGVISYVTVQRTREFGIRMALGATRRDILWNVLYRGGSLVAIGTAVGVVLWLPATRIVSHLLFETTPLDPATLGTTVVLLSLIAIAACLMPGIRASQVDPRTALNHE